MTDPIADMIIRIKNALLVNKAEVEMPHSKLKEAIAQILVEHKYIESVEVKPAAPQPTLLVKLRYINRVSAISDVKRLSKPGRRLYSPAAQIPRALGGYGITIISTSKGIITGQQARQLNVGGELLCQIW